MIKPGNIGREMLFKSLKDTIAQEIRERKLAPGTPILSTIQMSKKHHVSFVTANRAINELVKDGVLRRKRGSGTFVAGPEEAAVNLTLYLNGLDYESQKITQANSWFVIERLQKGIINAYPGSVKIGTEKEILQRALDGERFCAVLYNSGLPPVETLEKAGVPNVLVDYGDYLCLKNNSVRMESAFGAYALMAYLMGTLGHRRIGYIGGGMDRYHAARYAMYETAFRAFNLPFEAKYVTRGLEGHEPDGYEAMRRLLAMPDPPSVVFGSTDLLALGAVRAAKDAGLRVPEDISVAGFDDNPILMNFSPPLTTVSVPQDKIGRTAVEMLLERIRTGKDVETRIINSHLIIRESCAHAKQT